MKKAFIIISVLLVSLLMVSCSKDAEKETAGNNNNVAVSVTENENTTQTTAFQTEAEASTTQALNTGDSEVIDLTQLSSTVLYSELYNMLSQPDGYIGKTVKMRGTYTVYKGEGRNYYVCEVQDATACCNQGLEFVLKNEKDYPEYHSESPDKIEIIGVFNTYPEDGQTFVQLEDASVKVLE